MKDLSNSKVSPQFKANVQNDPIDDLLGFCGLFDFIWPLINWLQGYNKAIFTHSYEQAIMMQMHMKNTGVNCRVEGCKVVYK